MGERAVSTAAGSDSVTRLPGRWLLLASAAWLAAALTLGLVIAGVRLRFAALQQVCTGGGCTPLQLTPQGAQALGELGLSARFYAAYLVTLELTIPLIFAAVGAVLLWRRPGDRAALVVSFMLVTYGAHLTPFVETLKLAAPGWRFPGNLVHALSLESSLMALYLFPDGRFLSGWMRLLAVLWTGWTLAWLVAPDLPFNPSDPYRVAFGWLLVNASWYFSGIFVQIYRYRRVSGPVQQQQTKWIVFGATVAASGYVAFFMLRQLLPALRHSGTWSVLYTLAGLPLLVGALLLIPLSISMAILRYRLWDIDILINRTLVYGMLTAMLGLVYLCSVVLLQRVFLQLTGDTSSLAVVGSTLGIATLFQPLRRRIQVFIDRRFYRRKYDAHRTLQAFSERLRNETDLRTLTDDLLAVVEDTLQPAHVSLWLRSKLTD